MVKRLTLVGNSKALILPAQMIKKYGLEKIIIEETEDGIFIRPVHRKTNFQKAVDRLKREKIAIYQRMESQANESGTKKYYYKASHNLSEVDTDRIKK